MILCICLRVYNTFYDIDREKGKIKLRKLFAKDNIYLHVA